MRSTSGDAAGEEVTGRTAAAYGLGPGLQHYSWGDKDILTCRCAFCGNVTHWIPAPKCDIDKVGVNCRILGKEELEQMEVVKTPGPD